MRIRLFTILLVIVAAVTNLEAAVQPALKGDSPAVWQFDVFLDDKPIGSHKFRLQDGDAGLTISSEASFDVRFLLVNVFQYRHTSTEQWADGCLREFAATTRQNKRRFNVSGAANDGGFMVRTEIDDEAAREPLQSGCVKSFAYWNPNILEEERLLNNQTGAYQPIEVRALGRTTIRYNDSDLTAYHYALQTPKGEIKLWYESATGRWLALEAPAKGDRVIRYAPRRLPGVTLATNSAEGARYDF